MKKICVVTGTRAEYGLLKPLIFKMKNVENISLQLIVTGSHLKQDFGFTKSEIEKDGLSIFKEIPILNYEDTIHGTIQSMSDEMIEISKYFMLQKPDLVLILGDRYEIFAVAISAFFHHIPIAHIHGGEVTSGAIDDTLRHSITKMSSLHFTSTETYKKRVIQLGETPEFVYNVGALGVENVKNIKKLTKKELEETLNIELREKVFLVTFHPVTMETNTEENQFQQLINALDYFNDYQIIFTKANADTGGSKINRMIDEFVHASNNKHSAFASLGQLNYLSLIPFVSVVIGNSSSSIIEVPSYNIPTINIGDRQKGRMSAKSVLHCDTNTEDIIEKIKMAQKEDFLAELKHQTNPYDKENTSEIICTILMEYLSTNHNNLKEFYDL